MWEGQGNECCVEASFPSAPASTHFESAGPETRYSPGGSLTWDGYDHLGPSATSGTTLTSW